MNKLRIHTKVGVFEIMCETEPIEDLHSLVEKAFVDAQTTYFSGSTKNGVVAYFPKSVLKDCVIEIIESEEEDNAKS